MNIVLNVLHGSVDWIIKYSVEKDLKISNSVVFMTVQLQLIFIKNPKLVMIFSYGGFLFLLYGARFSCGGSYFCCVGHVSRMVGPLSYVWGTFLI